MSQDSVVGSLRFSARPTWRVIRLPITEKITETLEEETRKRDRYYTLAHVTESGQMFTLFFCLREEYRKQDNGQQRKQD